jgi:aconitate hydratase
MLIAPKGGTTELIKGPNIQSLPLFEALPDTLEVPFIKMGDDISTDGILKGS